MFGRQQERAVPYPRREGSLRQLLAAYSGPHRAIRPARRWGTVVALAIAVDAFAVLVASFLSTRSTQQEGLAVPSAGAIVSVLVVWIVLLEVRGSDDPTHLSPETIRRVVGVAVIALYAFIAASYLTHGWLPRRWVLLQVAIATPVVMFLRWSLGAFLRFATRRGDLRRRALIVGDAESGERLASRLTEDRGVEVVGCVATWSSEPAPGLTFGEGLQRLIRASGTDDVYVTSDVARLDRLHDIAHAVRQTGAQMRVASTLPEMCPARLDFETVPGATMIDVRPLRCKRLQRFAKRALDIVCSSTLLLLGLPLFAVVAIAHRMQPKSERGSTLFVQTRVGQGGRLFRMYKFRTMTADAETSLSLIAQLNEAEGPLFKIRTDPRITRLGAWLRRWSIDELPQLWNVLRGEMSLVGPRPPLPEEVERYERAWHRYRLDVPPGMTGLWQVNGRSSLSWEDYLRFDLKYVESWSFGLDLSILLRTIPAVLSRRGAS